MRRTIRLLVLAALIPLALPLHAQSGTVDAVDTRLFPLQYMSNASAAQLIGPFVQNVYPRWGVFDAGPSVRGVTVVASKEVLTRIDSLLKANDRPAATVVLRFQLIAAVDSTTSRDSGIPGDVDSTLRELFRYGGYQLIAQGSATVGLSNFSLSMTTADERRYDVTGTIGGGDGTAGGRGARGAGPENGTPATASAVQLSVSLTGPSAGQMQNLLATGLTVPLGQTVVLGTAAGLPGQRALILTVRPERLAPPR